MHLPVHTTATANSMDEVIVIDCDEQNVPKRPRGFVPKGGLISDHFKPRMHGLPSSPKLAASPAPPKTAAQLHAAAQKRLLLAAVTHQAPR